MKNLNEIIESLKIGSKSKVNDYANEYKEYGEGDFEQLDVEDFVNDKFSIQMRDNDIIKFYNTLKEYKINPDAKFWHIPEENVDKKIYTKLSVLGSKDPGYNSCYINIGDSKRPRLQIAFKEYPKTNLFVIIFVDNTNGKLINEYFLYMS